MQTESKIKLKDDDSVIVLAGDCPLIKKSTLQNLSATHQNKHASGTILTVTMENPGNYGRILRDQHFTVLGIREAKDCNPTEYAIKEINTGVYLFNGKSLFKHLKNITTNNAQKEYYLTDVLHLQQTNDEVIAAYCDPDDSQAIGVNTRADLALINKILYKRKADELMIDGVTLVDPESTFVDIGVEIGHDTVIEPFTVIKGHTHIGPHCHIQSHSYLKDVRVDAGTILTPFSRLVG
jgi:bifunctional UDP-N-acetylglucosamine pyrophosphorylase/glucosamine-1-phosphate N-acetyltransferase